MRTLYNVDDLLSVVGTFRCLKQKPILTVVHCQPHKVFAFYIVPAEVVLISDRKRKCERKLFPPVDFFRKNRVERLPRSLNLRIIKITLFTA